MLFAHCRSMEGVVVKTTQVDTQLALPIFPVSFILNKRNVTTLQIGHGALSDLKLPFANALLQVLA